VKVTVRGWNRDMGETVIANHFLPSVERSEDGAAWPEKAVLYRGGGQFTVAWFQPLKLSGNYRMEVSVSYYDITSLFRSLCGGVLSASLIENEGFTVSPAFARAVLKTIKLTDLTLGDLVAMQSAPAHGPATEEKLVEQNDGTKASSH
jgi:hypothetical protein